jgi:hypothetical protein
MRIGAAHDNGAIGQQRKEGRRVPEDSDIAVLHDVGALRTAAAHGLGDEPALQHEALVFFLEAGNVAVTLFEEFQFGRRKIRDVEVADAQMREHGQIDILVGRQADLGLRVEDADLLQRVAQVTGDAAVVEKQESDGGGRLRGRRRDRSQLRHGLLLGAEQAQGPVSRPLQRGEGPAARTALAPRRRAQEPRAADLPVLVEPLLEIEVGAEAADQPVPTDAGQFPRRNHALGQPAGH